MKGPYDDIINLPHHKSDTHPQMSIYNRAAQFAPFAALTGYDDAICEKARLTDDKIDMDEYEKQNIDRILQIISDNIENMPEVTITYFVSDRKKKGGAYIDYIGKVRRIDDVYHNIMMADGTIINIDDILDIKGELLDTVIFDE